MITKINAAEFHELLKLYEEFVVKYGAACLGQCKVMTRQFQKLEEEVFEIVID